MRSVVVCNQVASGWVYVVTSREYEYGWKTMVFQCTEGGTVIDWTDLDVYKYEDEADAYNDHGFVVSRWTRL